ncbi:MAG: type IX secretion system membrane protein PorP/SprF [Prolixibacteraceae bacterium]|nr:type IX secretion system membrane protein PorP/SprF [Prolixibacteraceae bacterium]
MNFLKYNLRTPCPFNPVVFVFVLLLISLGSLKKTFAQQDPMYTQYNFNTQTINPAYAGTWETLGFTVLGRYQWIGIDNSPHTYSLSLQIPTGKKNIDLGLNVVNDEIGLEQHLSIMADYSYRVRLNMSTSLRFGLRAGFTNYSNPLANYIQDVDVTQQEVFESMDSKLIPNFGVGAFIYNPDFYLSFSTPKILETKLQPESSDFNYSNYAELRHFYFQGAYVFPLGDLIKFKPTLLAKVTINAPIAIDVTANFLLADKFWIGPMIRSSKSFGFLAQWITPNNLRLGYAIDFNTAKLSPFGGTHELMVSYELNSRSRSRMPSLF